MIEAPHFSAAGAKKKAVPLPETLFDGTVNEAVLHQAVVTYLANQRQGTHQTKTRSFVTGGNQKPWRQKGTGRARVGEIRNPLWRHGGTVFGPQPRSYAYSLPKKVEIGALRAALAAKMQAGELVVVEALTAGEIKTKAAAELLKRLGVTGKAVLVDVAVDDNLSRSVRNIPGVSIVASSRLTARSVIDAARVVATKGAIEKLQETLS